MSSLLGLFLIFEVVAHGIVAGVRQCCAVAVARDPSDSESATCEIGCQVHFLNRYAGECTSRRARVACAAIVTDLPWSFPCSNHESHLQRNHFGHVPPMGQPFYDNGLKPIRTTGVSHRFFDGRHFLVT